MTRTRPPLAADTLEARLDHCLRLSGGTMPLCLVVKDEAERAQAMAYIAGKRGARLVKLETQAENMAKRAGWRGGRRG